MFVRALFVVFLPSAALAADLDAASHVDAVTLYPDAALVTRLAEIDLPAGESRVIFRGLPEKLDPTSLKLRIEGQATLGALETAEDPDFLADTPRARERRALQDQRDRAELAVEARAAEFDMVKNFGAQGEKSLPPDQWDAAWKNFGDGFLHRAGALRDARAELAALDAKLRAFDGGAVFAPGAAKRAMVEIVAPSAQKLRVAMTYRVAAAQWRPSYEARLDFGDGKAPPRLSFERRAELAQASGEDWSDVALTLTTFRVQSENAAPEVLPGRAEFFTPPPPLALARPRAALAAASDLAEERPASLRRSAFQASFVAPGRVSLASGAPKKTILLGRVNATPKLAWRVAPALDPRAFLSVGFANDDEAPLLAGPVALMRDGDLVGVAALPEVAPKSPVTLGFGADDLIRVARAPVEREEDVSGLIGQSKTETRDMRTNLRNLHGFPVSIELVDRAPYTENAAISVEILSRTTPPDEKDVDGKRGVMAWRFALSPNDSKAVELAYRVKWPADREIVIPSP